MKKWRNYNSKYERKKNVTWIISQNQSQNWLDCDFRGLTKIVLNMRAYDNLFTDGSSINNVIYK